MYASTENQTQPYYLGSPGCCLSVLQSSNVVCLAVVLLKGIRGEQGKWRINNFFSTYLDKLPKRKFPKDFSLAFREPFEDESQHYRRLWSRNYRDKGIRPRRNDDGGRGIFFCPAGGQELQLGYLSFVLEAVSKCSGALTLPRRLQGPLLLR
jgi:hypothetical protein